MQVAIDTAGRIVVPKALRDQLHLSEGTRLQITLREGRLELEPLPTPMRLVRRGGALVATSDEALPRIGVDEVRAAMESQRG